MKTRIFKHYFTNAGYALLMVLGVTAISFIVLTATLSRTYSVAKLNDRNNELILCQNAAEAAVEGVFARMQYDFQSAGGPAGVTNNLNSADYRGFIPKATDDAFWNRFVFSDGQGHANKTYVEQEYLYTGELPLAYSGRFTANAPVYRILSNARLAQGGNGVVGTAQQDVLLALVPLTAYAIFYNGLLEFSTCATMVVNGPVHSNTNIYVGTDASLTFNTTVTTSGTISAPKNNGDSWSSPNTYNSSAWRTYFRGSPSNYITKIPTIQIPIPMTNTYSLIEMPQSNTVNTAIGQQQLYNKAAVIVLVSNTSVTTIVQKSPLAGGLPAEDLAKQVTVYTNLTPSYLASALPFLTLTNAMKDDREAKTMVMTQIDIEKYGQWLTSTNANSPAAKYPEGSGTYPTILYVADNRTTNTSSVGFSVRVTDGAAPPKNGGQGFTIATPNPLYVWGDYNCPNAVGLGSTNTVAAGTVPSALMGDSLTILSGQWKDSDSYQSLGSSYRDAGDTTVNAAILTGIVPSTSNDKYHFSGGVHNLPRLLEDWRYKDLTINTSIINLFESRRATGVFVNPGTYYYPPTRKFSYDLKFRDPTQVPPGMPCALVALRFGWATPPPNTVTYNVSP